VLIIFIIRLHAFNGMFEMACWKIQEYLQKTRRFQIETTHTRTLTNNIFIPRIIAIKQTITGLRGITTS